MSESAAYEAQQTAVSMEPEETSQYPSVKVQQDAAGNQRQEGRKRRQDVLEVKTFS